MDIEEYKKLARNKIEADTLTRQVRDVIKITKWQKQNMTEGFKETFKPLIKPQDSIKKSIDEQQNATIAQLKKNQLALTQCGWPPVVHTTRGVANNQHERPKRSLFTGPRYNTFFLLLSSWILSPEITI